MKTIKTQVFFIVLSGIIASSLIIGGLGIFWSNTAVKRDSIQILDLMAQVQTQGLDSMFSEVEQASITISHYASENLSSVVILQDEERFAKYLAHMESISFYVAQCTNSAIAVYVRFVPEMVGKNGSFLWHKKDGVFVQESLDDFHLSADSDNDLYRIAKMSGKGVWTKPYYNESLKEYVISYGVPVYKNGNFVAVVGMDIDFDDIASLINSITIYDTGYAFLTDENFRVVYHRSIPADTPVFGEKNNFKLLPQDDVNSEFYEYKRKNKTFRMLSKNLVNGMRLVVSVPANEIDRSRTRLIYSLAFSVIIISLVVSLWSVWLSEKFTRPLKKLSMYARNIIAGDYDVEFDFSSTDEVGELISNFSFMAKSLKRQFEYINGLVYLDAMTGAKNKRAFIDERNDLNKRIKDNPSRLEFTVIVFDVNNLKYTNDNFGHKAGDILIKNACNLIMKNFSSSSVFRVGGDEFVAIVTEKDYQNRVELLLKMKGEMDDSKGEVSIAYGMADYDSEKDSDFQSVFEHADAEMYKTKVAMKGGRENVR